MVQEIFVLGWKPAGRDERVARHSPLYFARAKALNFQRQDRRAQLLNFPLPILPGDERKDDIASVVDGHWFYNFLLDWSASMRRNKERKAEIEQ